MVTHTERQPTSAVDIDSIIDLVKKNTYDFLFHCEQAGIGDQDLPTLVMILQKAGSPFTGENTIDAARDWLKAGFDADSAREWVRAGFWNVNAASKLSRIGIDASEALEIATILIYQEVHDNPIHALCNGDIGLKAFVLITDY